MNRLFGNLVTDNNITKKDGIIAILIYVALFVITYCEIKFTSHDMYIQILISLVWFCIIGIILKIRKQKIKTIGLQMQILPIVTILLITAFSAIYAVVQNSFELFIRWIYYLIAVGALEELIARGFPYPRIYKLFNNHWISLFITGAVFGAAHHIAPMVISGVPWYFVVNEIGGGIVGSFLYLLIYSKTGNILNAIIFHAIMDYSKYNGWMWLVFVLYAVILFIVKKAHNKKA